MKDENYDKNMDLDDEKKMFVLFLYTNFISRMFI